MAETKIVSDRLSDTLEFEFNELALGDGSASTPSLAFTNAQDTGLYYTGGSGNIGFSKDGVDKLFVTSDGIRVPDGTNALPSFTFINDIDSGIYRVAANQLGLAANGTLHLTVGDGQIIPSQPFRTSHVGSAAIPSYAFTADEDTGIFRTGSPGWAATVSGTQRFEINENQFRVTLDGSAAAPAITLGGDDDTGIYRSAADSISISSNGNEKVTFNTSGSAFVDGVTINTTDVGGTLGFQVRNNDNTNTSSNAKAEVVTGGTSAGDPYLLLAVTAGTQYSIGIDNSDSDIFKIGTSETIGTSSLLHLTAGGRLRVLDGDASAPAYSFINDPDTGIFKTGTSNEFSIATGGVERLRISTIFEVATLPFAVTDGSASSPSITFATDQDTGIYRTGTNSMALVQGGQGTVELSNIARIWNGNTRTQAVDVTATTFAPVNDNTIPCGASGNRWTDVFAVSGSVNTSHSTTKYDIQDLEDIEVPRAVRFKRKNDAEYRTGKEYIGYLNDNLPAEARAVLSDGTLDEKGNYESAVVGILCNAVRKLQEKVNNLESQLGS